MEMTETWEFHYSHGLTKRTTVPWMRTQASQDCDVEANQEETENSEEPIRLCMHGYIRTFPDWYGLLVFTRLHYWYRHSHACLVCLELSQAWLMCI
ncbi:hypothetical protein G9A89_015467 [Geosiphon pyriformis]|nr:hypothetical protein G9A89_015467 [Geosiphon pyriformis]